ncbi:MAG: isoprenylcysteine carboxylmethyltransferase family protein [Armatimonadota bacterium]
MSKTRIAIGTTISAIIVFLVIPAVYWLIVKALDKLIGLPENPITEPVALILTGLMWSLGLFWIFWAYSYLIFVGSGSPAEAFGIALEPTRQLVTTGPFAYVRNPMIFGLIFILLGVGFLANSVMGLALIPVAGLLAAAYIRLFEERELIRRFGDTYEHYKAHVPMLIPRPEPYVPPATPVQP